MVSHLSTENIPTSVQHEIACTPNLQRAILSANAVTENELAQYLLLANSKIELGNSEGRAFVRNAKYEDAKKHVVTVSCKISAVTQYIMRAFEGKAFANEGCKAFQQKVKIQSIPQDPVESFLTLKNESEKFVGFLKDCANYIKEVNPYVTPFENFSFQQIEKANSDYIAKLLG